MNKVAEPAKAEEVQPLGTYADDVVSVALSVTPAHDKLFCECTVLPEKSAEHVTVTTLEALINPHVAKDLITYPFPEHADRLCNWLRESRLQTIAKWNSYGANLGCSFPPDVGPDC